MDDSDYYKEAIKRHCRSPYKCGEKTESYLANECDFFKYNESYPHKSRCLLFKASFADHKKMRSGCGVVSYFRYYQYLFEPLDECLKYRAGSTETSSA